MNSLYASTGACSMPSTEEPDSGYLLLRAGRDPLNKLLRAPMAALRGVQILAYLNDISRILRSLRLALEPLATLVQSILSRFPC